MWRTFIKPTDKGFLTDYTDLRSAVGANAGETVSRYDGENTNIREEIVRCLWFGVHFPQDELRTDCGMRMEVLSPGWWNVEGGPDFIRAEFLMEHLGRLSGDVEVHTRASDWWRHGHHQNPEYNNVALHVVMWGNTGESPILKKNGEKVPQLTLAEYIEEEIAELADIVDMEGHSDIHREECITTRFCTRALKNGDLSRDALNKFLEAAGDHRFQNKAEMFVKQSEDTPLEQILYQNICEALGYKNNRLPFIQLARRLPLYLLRGIVPINGSLEEKSRILEAAYSGMAGLLCPPDTKGLDNDTLKHIKTLTEIWDDLPENLHEGKMTAAHWNMAGSRPANYPLRRIAALSRLYGKHLFEGLFGQLEFCLQSAYEDGRRRMDTVMREALTSTFTNLKHPYWSRRYSFHSRPMAKESALIGKQRANDLLTNVLLPLLLAAAHRENNSSLEEKVFQIWSKLPGNPENQILKRMTGVLLPENASTRHPPLSFRQQQGLQQLYNDCCSADKGCEECILYHTYRLNLTKTNL